MKKYILIFIFALIHGFTAGLQAQGTVVSGKVSDKDGQELVGVAVIETGTNHATGKCHGRQLQTHRFG